MSAKADVLAAIAKVGDKACCYAGGEWPKRRCDCKYGMAVTNPDILPGSTEKTGCPELREVWALLDEMTDDEWGEIHARHLFRSFHSDLPAMPEPAPEIIMDANGNYWRRYPTHLSMVPVSTDNDPLAEPVVVYRPAVAETGEQQSDAR